MAQKHLGELLREDQEPFLLKNYIADRRCQLKQSLPKTHLQLKKRKPISDQTTNIAGNLCKNACFFSFQDSPADVTKSPLFDFTTPPKSPCKSPTNAIFLYIPAKTAALLLEAALRIQKNSSKGKNQKKTPGFGLFGSVLKRLTNKNWNEKRKIKGDGVNKVSVKDILRWESSVGGRRKYSGNREKVRENPVKLEEVRANSEISSTEMGFSCSCSDTHSSAFWSESNEEKSLDMDTTSSSTSNSEDSEEIMFVSRESENSESGSSDKRFCKSPFRFTIQSSPSSGHRSPDVSSPATSPSRHNTEEKENYGGDGLKKLQQGLENDNEEEKEQCSPVSVLDPPFEDDEDGHGDDGDDEEDGGFDLECSYAIVQRAKQQLLQKLRRFEKLAQLDPIELEKRMLEEEEESENNEELEEEEISEEFPLDSAKNVTDFVREILNKSSCDNQQRMPADMKRLVTDLIAEEEKEDDGFEFDNREAVAKRVCKRLESWREVESNTIDMMVELDFRRELDGWKKNQDQMGDTAAEIELAIFGLLVEELSEELVYG